MSISAMKQALEALVELNEVSKSPSAICLPAEIDTAMDALRQAIEQAEQIVPSDYPNSHQPVAWLDNAKCKRLQEDAPVTTTLTTHRVFLDDVALYTAPPKREWIGLTKTQFEAAIDGLENLEDCWQAIEAKLKEKNCPSAD